MLLLTINRRSVSYCTVTSIIKPVPTVIHSSREFQQHNYFILNAAAKVHGKKSVTPRLTCRPTYDVQTSSQIHYKYEALMSQQTTGPEPI